MRAISVLSHFVFKKLFSFFSSFMDFDICFISCLKASNTSLLFDNASWNCWNFSPSAANCNRKFFSVVNNSETCSAYNFIWDSSCIIFSSCCLIFKSAI
nr:hypothetical protein Iba_chr01aCG13980 [Ipomoea batatas]